MRETKRGRGGRGKKGDGVLVRFEAGIYVLLKFLNSAPQPNQKQSACCGTEGMYPKVALSGVIALYTCLIRRSLVENMIVPPPTFAISSQYMQNTLKCVYLHRTHHWVKL
jgi:hypothetical protein